MKKFKVTVYIFRKQACCNPEEPTTLKALQGLNLEGIENIRMGRVFLLIVEAEAEDEARITAETACKKLLANPVMENFEIADISDSCASATA